MTLIEQADFKRLVADKAFLAFLYRMIGQAGLFSVSAPGSEARTVHYSEGRRSLCLDMLREVEAAQPIPSPDGMPLISSIQIFLNAAQTDAKEKSLGRRGSIYGDLDGDGSGE